MRAVKRSTLADANAERPAEFFEAIFQEQYARCAALAPRKRFHFQNKLYSFDSSVVDLCLSIFPWAKFRRTKGGIKLHTLLDHDGYIPAFVHITTASVADVNAAKTAQTPRRVDHRDGQRLRGFRFVCPTSREGHPLRHPNETGNALPRGRST
ncbi:MAG: hypothetical protein MZV70_68860 [Desulfobacterales bacterium]|nr:hypothetical protein [Desulfobacterales bacterium]